MTIYRLFSNKIPLCQFPNGIINEIIVTADNENDARELICKDYKNSFVCKFDEIEIESIGNANNPQIIKISYTSDIF